MKNRFMLGLIILLAAIGLVFVLLYSRQNAESPDEKAAMQDLEDAQFLRSEMTHCMGVAQSDNCYKQAADIFMAKWQYPRILALLKENEQYPEIFSRCHELAHYLGRQAYELEKSVSKTYSQATSVCWGGFYHGVMEAYFFDKHLTLTNPDSPEIAAALKTACGFPSDYTSPRFYSECVHGIGHAMMFITNTDLNKSLALCDRLGNQETITCYGGVFMENSSSSTNTAHPTNFLKASDPMYPCNALAARYLETCYQYQSSYFAQLSNYDWKKNAGLCEQVPAKYQPGCFHIIGSNQVGSTQDYLKMKSNCELMPNAVDIDTCFAGVVDGLSGRYVDQVNKVAAFCAILDLTSQKNCFQNLGRNIQGWSSDSNKIAGFCAELKNPEYIEWCKSGPGFDPSSQSFN